jgi:predicted nucleic acid-binding protein
VDTAVWIDFLRGVPKAVAFVATLPHNACISSISVAELFAGVRDGQETQALTKLLDTLEIIELNRSIAQTGGLIRRDFGKSHGLGLNDALIAATAIHAKACLYTLNISSVPTFSHQGFIS